MRTIGLLGGMSFESTSVYYRLINELVRNRIGGLHSAEMILYSVDFQTIVDMQKAGRWENAGQRLAVAACSLEQAGAACVLICTNTMHIVADSVQKAIHVPLLNIIDGTARRLREFGSKRPLLLATGYTMEHGFYASRMREHGLEIALPDQGDREVTHNIIFNELCSGRIEASSRSKLTGIIEKARVEGSDAVIFGCTELGLILDQNVVSLPVFDSTTIHCEAAVEFALSS